MVIYGHLWSLIVIDSHWWTTNDGEAKWQ